MFSSTLERLNDRRNSEGESGADAGFTLIELMVVLLILAILLAIAIPTFLGVTNSANDRAAQSNLNTALTNAKAAYENGGQTYTGVTVASLSSSEPGLSFIQGSTAAGASTNASSSQNLISVFAPTDGNSIVLAAYSVKTKNCWAVVDSPATQTSTGAPFTSATGNLATTTGTSYYKFANATVTSCNAGNFGVAYTTTSTSGFPS